MSEQKNIWPKNFLWGAATSAHQVEGNNHNDWTEWEKLGRVERGEKSGLASGHFDRYAADFGMAKELGHNAHRLSLEWSRIEPRPGFIDPQAIAHYRAVLTELRRLGIEPMVTLWHFTNPIWITAQGGWKNKATADCYGRYVMAVVHELGDLVTHWITINEPTVYSSLSYMLGYWPPEQKNPLAAWHVIRNFVAAHQLAYQIIHRHNSNAKVGVANNLNDFIPSRKNNIADKSLAVFSRYWHNQWWLDQTYQTQDFIGLNYYFHHPLKFQFSNLRELLRPQTQPRVPLSDVGWEIYPRGLGNVLSFLATYNRPIIITENGLADSTDSRRANFIREHVAEIHSALKKGIRIQGYLHWSLLDNFEWREGFAPRFGLIEVDYQTQLRTIRPSAYTYREIIRQAQA